MIALIDRLPKKEDKQKRLWVYIYLQSDIKLALRVLLCLKERKANLKQNLKHQISKSFSLKT